MKVILKSIFALCALLAKDQTYSMGFDNKFVCTVKEPNDHINNTVHYYSNHTIEGLGSYQPDASWEATSSAMRADMPSRLDPWDPDYMASHDTMLNLGANTLSPWDPDYVANTHLHTMITEMLQTIQTADLDTAIKTFENLRHMTSSEGIQVAISSDTHDINMVIGDVAYRQKILQKAQGILTSRSDYKAYIRNKKITQLIKTYRNNIYEKQADKFRLAYDVREHIAAALKVSANFVDFLSHVKDYINCIRDNADHFGYTIDANVNAHINDLFNALSTSKTEKDFLDNLSSLEQALDNVQHQIVLTTKNKPANLKKNSQKSFSEAAQQFWQERVLDTVPRLDDDLIATPARKYSYNISPEVDQYLDNLFDHIQKDRFTSFEEYQNWVELLLTVNASRLTPEQSASLLDQAAYAAHLMKIAGGEFVSRLDPSVQLKDYASIIKELGLFTVDMGLCTAHILQFGDLAAKDIQTNHGIVNTRDIMPERLRHRIEMLESLGAKVPEIMAQLAQLPAEDQARIIGRILGDMAFAKGVTKTIALLKEGNLSAVLQEIGAELNEVLEGAKESAAVTAEGAAVKVGQTLEEGSLLQDTEKVVSGAQEVISAERGLLEQVYKTMLNNLEKELSRIKELFDCKRKGFAEFANKYLKIDYKHILGFELQFTRRGMPSLGGLHHDFMNVIEKSGVLEFANKIMYESGFYKVEARYLGNKVKDITFFPAHWSREQVMSKIFEAYDNFIKNGAKFIEIPGGKYFIESKTNDGIDIVMYITKKGLITSAYPTFK